MTPGFPDEELTVVVLAVSTDCNVNVVCQVTISTELCGLAF